MSVEYVERVYDRCSGFYDLVFGKVFESGREMAPRLLKLHPGTRLLEVGIGTGLSLQLMPDNIDITGIDLSEKMLAKAHKRVATLGMNNVNLIKMDATQMQFPDNSFDRVLAAYFISTVPDWVTVRAVEEMKRVCRPGGYILFLNHFQNEHPFIGAIEKLISPFCFRIGFRTDLNLNLLMQETGLEIETLERIDWQGHWKAVRCICVPGCHAAAESGNPAGARTPHTPVAAMTSPTGCCRDWKIVLDAPVISVLFKGRWQ
jgi:phosphatidylethanolamine/phosphatidyl-N-methylethanolamine N-methyltransferase